jgi:hypothetical protein
MPNNSPHDIFGALNDVASIFCLALEKGHMAAGDDVGAPAQG